MSAEGHWTECTRNCDCVGECKAGLEKWVPGKQLANLDREALMRQAREKAKREAERRWPPSGYGKEMKRDEDALALRYYREFTGAEP